MMRLLQVIVLSLLSFSGLQAALPSRAEIDAKTLNMMFRIQGALAVLSKTTPLLQGIEQTPILPCEISRKGHFIRHEMEFQRNTYMAGEIIHQMTPFDLFMEWVGSWFSRPHFTTISSTLNQAPCPSWLEVGPHGLDLYVGITEIWPHRETTKSFGFACYNEEGLKLYYFVGTHEVENGDAKSVDDEDQKKAICDLMNSYGAEFENMLPEPLPAPDWSALARHAAAR